MAKVTKCILCAYTFKGNEEVTKEGNYICPYCGTIRYSFFGNEDFKRTNLIIDGYRYLSESNLKEASKSFTNYSADYGDDDPQVELGKALLECRLSNCLSYKSEKLITVVHQESVKDILDTDAFNVIKNSNPSIYNNVISLANKENIDNVKANSVIILSTDLGALDRLEGLIEDYSTVLPIDLLNPDIESLIYPNMALSKALVIFVNNKELLNNAYFLSVYYRFKALCKNVVFVYEDIRIPEMYSEDTKIKSSDPLIKDKLSLGIHKVYGTKVDSKNLGYVMDLTTVKSISGKDVILPTNAVSIASRACLKGDTVSLTISSTGEFYIHERAFSESSLESLSIQSKNCNLHIEKDAFSDSKALKNVTFSNDKIEIQTNAFRNCVSLREINLSMFSNLEIKEHTFDGAKSLTKVKLPKDILSISKYAFKNTQLEELTITTKTIVDPKAFSDTNTLMHVKVLSDPVINLKITEETFPLGCLITFVGKEAKKVFKETKKYKKLYKLQYLKNE